MQILPPDLSRLRPSGAGAAAAVSSLPDAARAPRPGSCDEYVFISLYLIAAESFASEQASRLVAMDSSTRNTEQMLETLIDLERRERQGEITRAGAGADRRPLRRRIVVTTAQA